MNDERARRPWLPALALCLSAVFLASRPGFSGYAPGCTVALTVPGSVAHEFHDVVVQPDGKFVAVGYVEKPGGDTDFLVARFHPDLTLDLTFAAPNGYVTRDIYLKGEHDQAFAVAIQSDLKIVVAGFADFNSSKRDMGFARYNPDGTLDAGFGAFGVDFKSSAVDVAYGITVAPDGKIVAAGYYTDSGTPRIAVLRFLKDGTLDPMFGDGTPDLAPIPLSDIATDVVLDRQGRILLSVTVDRGTSKDFAVVRLDNLGELDPAFTVTGMGWSALDIGTNSVDDTAALLLRPDDSIILAGTSNGNMAVARFLPNGPVDAAFGSGGSSTHDFGGPDMGHDVAVDSGGNLVVAGQARFVSVELGVARFFSSGGFDSAFSNDVTPADDIAYAVEILETGKILLVGSTAGFPSRVGTLALFNPDGTQDCGEKVLHPTADGPIGATFSENCTAEYWKCVNDQTGFADEGTVEPADGDVTFIQGSVPVAQALFELADGKLPPGKVVTELEITGRMRWVGGAGTPEVQLMFTRNGFGPPVLGNVLSISNVTYQNFSHRFVGLNMSSAELDALRIGIDYSAGQGVALTQLYVRVVFGDSLLHPVQVFTATATGDAGGGRVLLNWLNPSSGLYDETVIHRVPGCPAGPGVGVPVATGSAGLGKSGNAADAGLANGTPYFYTAYVEDADNNSSTGVCIQATPFDATLVKTEWIYRTGISILTTPGLRVNFGANESVAYTVANDGLVHAVFGGPVADGGGLWPAGWAPPRLGAAAPDRPVLMPLPPTNQLALVTGAEDGRVYAVDAVTGEFLWRSAPLAATIVGSPAAALTLYSASKDFVFVGSRVMGARNRFYALNASDGTVAWFFDNPGGADIGMIIAAAVVDPLAEHVYFTSHPGPSMNAIWCLDYTVTPPAACPGWSPNFGVAVPSGGEVETSPILYKGVLYVSDVSPGDLYAVDPSSGLSSVVAGVGGSGVNGYVFPRFFQDIVFASSTGFLHAINTGSGVIWSEPASAPSTPLHVPGTDQVYVGTINGLLRMYSASSGGAPIDECVGDCSTTQVGSPAYDVLRRMMYAGTADGEVYAFRTPF